MKHIILLNIAMLSAIAHAAATKDAPIHCLATHNAEQNREQEEDRKIREFVMEHKDSPEMLNEILIDLARWKTPDLELAKLLITLGASATARDPGSLFGGPLNHGNPGAAAITSAADYGHPEFVALLLDHGASIETNSPWNGFTALMNAAKGCYNHKKNEYLDTLKLLLARGANVNAQNNSSKQTALMLAAYYAQPKKVRLLLEAGADITLRDERGDTAMKMVSPGTFSQHKRKYTKIAELLTFHNPDAQKLYQTQQDLSACTPEQLNDILAAAAQSGDLPKVKDAIAAGANPLGTADTLSPLMRAVHGEHLDVAQHLLSCGAHVNMVDTTLELSPFHLAVRKGNLPLIKMLVANGADTKKRTKGKYCVATLALLSYDKKPAYADTLAYVTSLVEQR